MRTVLLAAMFVFAAWGYAQNKQKPTPAAHASQAGSSPAEKLNSGRLG
jgi:hypothetical protein